MAAADLRIIIGAKPKESAKQIENDLSGIVDNFDKKPLRIKVGIDTDSIEQSVTKAIPQIQKSLNKALSNAVPIQVNVKPNVSGSSGAKQKSVGQVQDTLRASLVQTKEYLKSLGMTEVEVNAKVKNIQDKIDSLQVASLGNYIAKDIKRLETEVQKLNRVKEQFATELKELNDLFKSSNGKSTGKSSNDLEAQIKQIGIAIDSLDDTSKIPAIKKQLKELSQELKGVDLSKFKSLEAELNAMTSRSKKLGREDQTVKNIAEARRLYAEISQTDFKKLSFEDQTKEVERLEAALRSVKDVLEESSATDTFNRSTASIGSTVAKLIRRMDKFKETYTRLGDNPQLQAQFDGLYADLTKSSHKSQADVINLKKGVEEFEDAARKAGITSKSLGEWLSAAYQKFGGWALVTTSMMKTVQVMEQMVVSVRNLDSAMTELRKVTNETDASYNQFFQRASNQAKEIGTTMTNYINSTADFARLGYSLGDAEELAKTTAIYYNVADGMESIDEATQSVISTMKAFGLDVKDSIDIVDLFNHTSNNFAISSAGIGEAMQRSASALKESGSTIEEAVALITAANSVIQDPMKVGNSLKTLSLRMRGAKVDLEEAGLATDGMAESTSKLRKEILALTGQKVDIMLDENTFKSPFKMLEELSQVWGSMTDINKAAALELLGGKQQANILASLITNFQTAKDVMEEAGNAAGSAMEENERQLDSINGKINQFKANFESLSATVIDSELVKGTVDFGSGMLHGLDTIMQKLGTFPTLLGAVAGGFASVKAIGKINCPLTPRKQGVGCLLNGIEIETIKLLGMAKALSPIGSRKTETRIGMVYAEIKAA